MSTRRGLDAEIRRCKKMPQLTEQQISDRIEVEQSRAERAEKERLLGEVRVAQYVEYMDRQAQSPCFAKNVGPDVPLTDPRNNGGGLLNESTARSKTLREL